MIWRLLASLRRALRFGAQRPAAPGVWVVDPFPSDYVGCALHGPCCGLPEHDPCWDRTDYMRPSEWERTFRPKADPS